MHVTHHIPKIEAGSYQCPTAPSWGHPKGAEHDAGSGGSLHKWFRIAEEQNGLDRKVGASLRVSKAGLEAEKPLKSN